MNRAAIKVPTFTRAAVLRLGAAAAVALLLAFMGCEIINYPPSIDINIPEEALTGSKQEFTAVVEDLDEDPVIVTWFATDGDFDKPKPTGKVVKWTAPVTTGKVIITAVANDRKLGGTDTTRGAISVVNSAPVITDFSSSTPYVTLGKSVTLTCEADDPEGEDITFEFYTSPSDVGEMDPPDPQETNTATWTAPDDPNLARIYDLIVRVSDVPQGYYSSDTLQVLVYSENGTIWIVDKVQSVVTKFTSRGEKILSASHSFQKPVAVTSYRSKFYGCYVADQDAGQIVKLDEEGNSVTTFSDLPNVIDLAINRETSTLWAICHSKNEPRLTVIDTDTESIVKQVKGLRHPNAITINQNRQDVWIADYGYEQDDRVIQINIRDFLIDLPDSLTSLYATIFEGNFNYPSSLSVRDAEEATVYIADTYDDEVERLTYNPVTEEYYRGTAIDLSGGGTKQPKPFQVRVTDAGLVWVLSLDRSVQYFPEDITTPTQKTSIGSYAFLDPHAMAIDQITGNVWIGDNGRHQVVEISSADSVGVTISGFSFVEDIVIIK